MKTLIVAINSKFIHSNLAVLYISAACTPECGEIKVVEFSINEPCCRYFPGLFEKIRILLLSPAISGILT